MASPGQIRIYSPARQLPPGFVGRQVPVARPSAAQAAAMRRAAAPPTPPGGRWAALAEYRNTPEAQEQAKRNVAEAEEAFKQSDAMKKAQKAAEDAAYNKLPWFKKAIVNTFDNPVTEVVTAPLSVLSVPLKGIALAKQELSAHLPRGAAEWMEHPFGEGDSDPKTKPGVTDALNDFLALVPASPFGVDADKARDQKRGVWERLAPRSDYGMGQLYPSTGNEWADRVKGLGGDIFNDPLMLIDAPTKIARPAVLAKDIGRTSGVTPKVVQAAQQGAETAARELAEREALATLTGLDEGLVGARRAAAEADDVLRQAPMTEIKPARDIPMPHNRKSRATIASEWATENPELWRTHREEILRGIKQGFEAMSPEARADLGVTTGGWGLRGIIKEIPGTEPIRQAMKEMKGVRREFFSNQFDRLPGALDSTSQMYKLRNARALKGIEPAFQKLRQEGVSQEDAELALSDVFLRNQWVIGHGQMQGRGAPYVRKALREAKAAGPDATRQAITDAETQPGMNWVNKIFSGIADVHERITGKKLMSSIERESYVPNVLDVNWRRNLATLKDPVAESYMKQSGFVKEDLLEASHFLDSKRKFHVPEGKTEQKFNFGGKEVTLKGNTIDDKNAALREAFPDWEGDFYSKDLNVIAETYLNSIATDAGARYARTQLSGTASPYAKVLDGLLWGEYQQMSKALERKPFSRRLTDLISQGYNRQQGIEDIAAAEPVPASGYFKETKDKAKTAQLREDVLGAGKQWRTQARTDIDFVNAEARDAVEELRRVWSEGLRDAGRADNKRIAQLKKSIEKVREWTKGLHIGDITSDNADTLVKVLVNVDGTIAHLQREMSNTKRVFNGRITRESKKVDDDLAAELRKLKKVRDDLEEHVGNVGRVLREEINQRRAFINGDLAEKEAALAAKEATVPKPSPADPDLLGRRLDLLEGAELPPSTGNVSVAKSHPQYQKLVDRYSDAIRAVQASREDGRLLTKSGTVRKSEQHLLDEVAAARQELNAVGGNAQVSQAYEQAYELRNQALDAYTEAKKTSFRDLSTGSLGEAEHAEREAAEAALRDAEATHVPGDQLSEVRIRGARARLARAEEALREGRARGWETPGLREQLTERLQQAEDEVRRLHAQGGPGDLGLVHNGTDKQGRNRYTTSSGWRIEPTAPVVYKRRERMTGPMYDRIDKRTGRMVRGQYSRATEPRWKVVNPEGETVHATMTFEAAKAYAEAGHKELTDPPLYTFHGTKNRVDEFTSEGGQSSENLLGPALYTTQDRSAARKYRKKGRNEGKPSEVYRIEGPPGKHLDMDKTDMGPAVEARFSKVIDIVEDAYKANGIGSSVDDLIEEAHRKIGYRATGMKMYEDTKDLLQTAISDGVLAKWDVDDILRDLNQGFREDGYVAFTHTGGIITDQDRLHRVVAWLDPSEVKMADVLDPVSDYDNVMKQLTEWQGWVEGERPAHIDPANWPPPRNTNAWDALDPDVMTAFHAIEGLERRLSPPTTPGTGNLYDEHFARNWAIKNANYKIMLEEATKEEWAAVKAARAARDARAGQREAIVRSGPETGSQIWQEDLASTERAAQAELEAKTAEVPRPFPEQRTRSAQIIEAEEKVANKLRYEGALSEEQFAKRAEAAMKARDSALVTVQQQRHSGMLSPAEAKAQNTVINNEFNEVINRLQSELESRMHPGMYNRVMRRIEARKERMKLGPRTKSEKATEAALEAARERVRLLDQAPFRQVGKDDIAEGVVKPSVGKPKLIKHGTGDYIVELPKVGGAEDEISRYFIVKDKTKKQPTWMVWRPGDDDPVRTFKTLREAGEYAQDDASRALAGTAAERKLLPPLEPGNYADEAIRLQRQRSAAQGQRTRKANLAPGQEDVLKADEWYRANVRRATAPERQALASAKRHTAQRKRFVESTPKADPRYAEPLGGLGYEERIVPGAAPKKLPELAEHLIDDFLRIGKREKLTPQQTLERAQGILDQNRMTFRQGDIDIIMNGLTDRLGLGAKKEGVQPGISRHVEQITTPPQPAAFETSAVSAETGQLVGLPPPRTEAQAVAHLESQLMPERVPPVPEDHIRLWRGDLAEPPVPTGQKAPDWILQQPEMKARKSVEGRWFDTKRSRAELYPTNRDPDELNKLSYVDVPKAEYEQWRNLANVPDEVKALSKAAENEVVLPPEWMDRVQDEVASAKAQGEKIVPGSELHGKVVKPFEEAVAAHEERVAEVPFDSIEAKVRINKYLGAQRDEELGGFTAQHHVYENMRKDLTERESLLRKRSEAQALRKKLIDLPRRPKNDELIHVIEQLEGIAKANPLLDNQALNAAESLLQTHLQALQDVRHVQDLDMQVKHFMDMAKNEDLPNVMRAVLNDNWDVIHKGVLEQGDVIIDKRLAVAMQNMFDLTKEPGVVGRWFKMFTNLFKTYATLSPGFQFRNILSGGFMNLADGVPIPQQIEAVGLWRKWARGGEDWLIKQPLNTQHAFAATFASGAGGRVAEAGVAGKSQYRLYNLASNNPATRLFQRAGERVEGSLRLAMAMHSIDRGESIAGAVDRIGRVHFNYAEVSRFDEAAKTLIPFWTFMSRNMPLQLQEMFTNPKMYAAYGSFQRNFSAPEAEYTPEYWKGLGTFRLPFNLGGQPAHFQPDLGFTRVGQDIKNVTDTLSGQNPLAILSSVNPGFSAPLDFAYGKDSFTNRTYGPEDYSKMSGPVGRIEQVIASLVPGQTNEQGQVSDNFLNFMRSVNPLLDRTTRLAPGTVGESADANRTAESWARFLGIPYRTLSPKQQESEAMRRYYAMLDEVSRQRAMASEAAS